MLSFVAKNENPALQDTCIGEFTIPSLKDFSDGDGEEMLLCPVRL